MGEGQGAGGEAAVTEVRMKRDWERNVVRGPETTLVLRRPRLGDHRSQTRLFSLGKYIKREMKRLEVKREK